MSFLNEYKAEDSKILIDDPTFRLVKRIDGSVAFGVQSNLGSVFARKLEIDLADTHLNFRFSRDGAGQVHMIEVDKHDSRYFLGMIDSMLHPKQYDEEDTEYDYNGGYN